MDRPPHCRRRSRHEGRLLTGVSDELRTKDMTCISPNFLCKKLRGLRQCLAENGLYYTWHHFVGKIGRRLSGVRGMGGVARWLLAYAHELRWFMPREDGSDEVVFPVEARPLSYTCANLPAGVRRVVLFAVFTPDGRIPETTHIYLRGLRSVADVILCVGDCPIRPDALEELKTEVEAACFIRHGKYDFGSYSRAYQLAEELGLLASAPEVVLANDSCYGPVYPLTEAFDSMALRHVDFWGMTANLHMGLKHLQSYFYCFGSRVVASGEIKDFLANSEKWMTRKEVIEQGEKRLTHDLEQKGYSWSSYVDYLKLRNNPTTFPVRLLRFRCPLIKVKAIDGESHESIRRAMKMLAAANLELYRAICAKISQERNPDSRPL